MNKKSKKGFTLVEIMIVVVIIGLLAAMAIPAFQQVRENAIGRTMTNDARQLASAAQQYMLENAVTTVIVTGDTATGEVTGPLNAYVRQIGRGTVFPGSINQDEDFDLSNPQFDGGAAQTYSAEGQPQED